MVEQTAPVSPGIIARHALAAQLTRVVHAGARIEGDKVVERAQAMFGTIEIGEPISTDERSPIISEDAQRVMVDRVLNLQGSGQRALREVANELALYTKAIPPLALQKFLRDDAPELITDESIEKLIRLYAERTTSVSHIDQLIRDHMYSKNIGIDRYFTPANREYLHRCAPQEVTLSSSDVLAVQYRDNPSRTPYVSLPPRMFDKLGKLKNMNIKNELLLPDGREILVKRGDTFMSVSAF